MKKKIRLAGLSISCPKCKGIAHKQIHCTIPTYFCVKCNETFILKNEWIEQHMTNTRKFQNIEDFFEKDVED
jgi:transposase-like protein